jgi:dipeptidase D
MEVMMGKVLEGLKPEKVFYYFEEISKIPRCSGKEKQISDYLYNFAKSKNLEAIQDEHLNVIIKKPASKGYENAPTVMLQGHMDMVC